MTYYPGCTCPTCRDISRAARRRAAQARKHRPECGGSLDGVSPATQETTKSDAWAGLIEGEGEMARGDV